MSTLYPGSIDNGTTLPNPSASQDTNSPSLSAGQGNQNDALIAVETKLGTGSSTPSGTYALVSTGTGSSTWSLATPTGTIVGTSDTQTLTNKTIDASNNTITNLSGSDLASLTITATQIANGTITATQIVSNSTSGLTNSNLSGSAGITGANIATNGVGGSNLATNAILLGYASVNSGTFTTTSGTAVLITGLSVGVTVPTGGRSIEITGYIPAGYTSGANQVNLYIYSGTTVAGGTLLQESSNGPTTAITAYTTMIQTITTPSSGSQNYFIAVSINGGSTYALNQSTNVNPYISVKLI